ncbi:MAG TPA: hypothetical protein DCS91_00650 [Microcoleaceae bacterium UBA11344]|jgi:hypothetical protein|nr:hypothetical protein [Microcoleaceae cyanobacterium UBA11344]
MSIPQLKPADDKEVKVYAPFCQESRRRFLPQAIALYKLKSLEGARKIDGGDDVPFVASWNISSLPIDLTRCRVLFDGNPELSYEVTMQSSEFVSHLIEVLLNFHRTRTVVDFSKPFYRKLMRMDE